MHAPIFLNWVKDGTCKKCLSIGIIIMFSSWSNGVWILMLFMIVLYKLKLSSRRLWSTPDVLFLTKSSEMYRSCDCHFPSLFTARVVSADFWCHSKHCTCVRSFDENRWFSESFWSIVFKAKTQFLCHVFLKAVRSKAGDVVTFLT